MFGKFTSIFKKSESTTTTTNTTNTNETNATVGGGLSTSIPTVPVTSMGTPTPYSTADLMKGKMLEISNAVGGVASTVGGLLAKKELPPEEPVEVVHMRYI
jgi:hypothetical protein